MPAPALRALRGAPITCLVALMVIGRPATNEEIGDEAGYGASTVENALRILQKHDLALALPNGRHPRWALPRNSPQIPMGWLVAQVSRENRDSGSSSLQLEESQETQGGQLQLPQVSREKRDSLSTSYPQTAALAAPLVRAGCPTSTARAAVQAALDDGDAPAAIETQIARWLAYCARPRAATITAPGLFTAAKIRKNEPCPPLRELRHLFNDEEPPSEAESPDDVPEWEEARCGHCGHPYLDHPQSRQCINGYGTDEQCECFYFHMRT